MLESSTLTISLITMSFIYSKFRNASILDEAAQHRLETLGGALPVQVTEVLAYSDSECTFFRSSLSHYSKSVTRVDFCIL